MRIRGLTQFFRCPGLCQSNRFWRAYISRYWRSYSLILTPIILLPIIFSGIPKSVAIIETNSDGNASDAFSTISPKYQLVGEDNYEPMVCAYTLLLMAIYWMTEALPLPVTSLLPIVIFPLLGVLSTSEVAMNYMRATNFMMLGGLMLAVCVEHSGLHKRIALRIVLMIGTSEKMALLGFMVTTAFVSMWISNAATAAMMVPIIDAYSEIVYEGAEEARIDRSLRDRNSYYNSNRNMLLLAVGYSASIGGTGVITGNPSNLVLLEIMPPEAGVSFATWMAFSIPLAIVNLLLAWVWLSALLRWSNLKKFGPGLALNVEDPKPQAEPIEITSDVSVSKTESEIELVSFSQGNTQMHEKELRELLKKQYDDLGKTSTHEWSILLCFVILVLLWFFRQPMFMTGWGDFLERMTKRGTKVTVADATPAMLMVVLIFVIPIQYNFWPFSSSKLQPVNNDSLVSWAIIEQRVPWGVLLFLGGGFALSDACTKTGFSQWFVKNLTSLGFLPSWVVNLVISMLTATITEVVSNTATANILLPIIKDMAINLCENPTYLVMTSVVTCCYAFMLPVATAPNAIIYGASCLTQKDMIKAGLVMNIICVLTTNLAINSYGIPLFGLGSFPEWAVPFAEKANLNCTA